MSAPFHLRVRLAEPLREGVGEFVEITTPVATLGDLVTILEVRVPQFAAKNDEIINFAINGELILHDERAVALRSGDEIELLVALSGG